MNLNLETLGFGSLAQKTPKFKNGLVAISSGNGMVCLPSTEFQATAGFGCLRQTPATALSFEPRNS